MSEWHERWSEGRLGFHKSEVHADLIAYEEAFLGNESRRVLVPLCGKTLDLSWLAERGHEVVGVELVSKACEDFFTENGLAYERSEQPGLQIFRSGNITLINGDIFDVSAEAFGRFDRIWDRAALVALPAEVRTRYAAHLRALASDDGILLQNAFEYDQSKMSGPPFSVSDEELRTHYQGAQFELLRETDSIADVQRFRDRGLDSWIVRSYLIRL